MNPTKTSADTTRARLVQAAHDLMLEKGYPSTSVDEICKQAGATKGSFYHHFQNRQALLVAALARWEEIVAADLVDGATISDPRARLLAGSLVGVAANLDGFVDLALAASINEPVVAAALERTNARRIDWLMDALCDAGFDREEAHDRAIRALSGYLGLYQLQRTLGETFDRTALVNQITAMVENMLR